VRVTPSPTDMLGATGRMGACGDPGWGAVLVSRGLAVLATLGGDPPQFLADSLDVPPGVATR
jgi:hypothetical protein